MTTPTITTTNPCHAIYRNTNNFILFVSLIIFCTIPLISCKSDGKGNGVDASGELRKQLISSHNIEHSNSGWKSEKAENEELHPQLFAAYHESYITKAAAKDFRKKIRSHKKPITEQDYNDLLQDIVLKPIDKPKNDIYEKKYFDYLPAEEEIDLDVDDDSNDYRIAFDGTTNDSELGDDLNGYDEFSDEENENLSETMIHRTRYRRDIKEDSQRLIQNEKRHAVWDQGHHQTIPLTFYISRERQQPINPFIFGTAIYNDLNPNNPWNNRFYGTSHLNNFYLPVAPPPQAAGYVYPRPSIPFSIFIPGHNVGVPPDNPAPTTEGTPMGTLVNRFGDGDQEPSPVWGYTQVDDIPQVQQNSLPNAQDNSQQPTTRRPSPPLIHKSDEKRPEIPERRPPQQGINQQEFTTIPPSTRRPSPSLIHNSDSQNSLDAGRPSQIQPTPTRRPSPSLIHNSDSQNSLDAGRPSQIQPTPTRRPSPSLVHNSDLQNSLDAGRPPSQIPTNLLSSSNRQGGSGLGVGPIVGAPVWDDGQSNRPFVNQRPQQIDTPVLQLGPSRCVWGIVNCCSRQDIRVRYACFERIGCHGAFWDLNPCGDDILDAAIGEVDQFFN